MYRIALALIVLLLPTSLTFADPQQDALRDIQEFSGLLRNVVVKSSTLVENSADAAEAKVTVKQVLNSLEKHWRCKATKSVEIDSKQRMVSVTFVSRTLPVLSILIIAQNDKLIMERTAIGEYKIVDFDPLGIDR
jgi:hypothetical protein